MTSWCFEDISNPSNWDRTDDMGTDIHLHVQKRHPETGEWVHMRDVPDEAMSEWALKFEADHRGESWWSGRSWFDGRNYNLFAILADVRNGVGFGGFKTGDGFKTMTSEQRGLPDDFVVDQYLLDHDDPEHCHSTNWVSLKEVLDFPWRDLETNHLGVVDEHEFKQWLEKGGTGGPSSWSGGVTGSSVRHVDIPTMTGIVKGTIPREEGERITYYTRLEWGESYHDSCRYFCETTVPALEKLADGDPKSVRLVFWFDS